MNKTLTSWLSVIIAFFLCLPLYAWNGSGTYEDPYEIATASDVADLVVAVNGGADQSGVYFLQTADIDLSTFGNFTPIGSASAPFAGNYDGDGYILSNLTITASVSGATTNAFGFFGYCQNATIENTITHGKIDVLADYNSSACVAVGGVVGIGRFSIYAADENYCDITLVLSNAPVNQDESYSIKYGLGGVVGILRDATSKNYYSLANYGKLCFFGMDGVCCIGGIANFRCVYTGADTSSGFTECFNYGKIVCNGSANAEVNEAYCSGIVSCHYANYGGGVRPNRITRSVNYGEIISTGSVHTAGILVQNGASGSERASINSCTNYGNIRGVHSQNYRACYGGIGVFASSYSYSYIYNSANYGGISVSGNGSASVGVCGVGVFRTRGSGANQAPANSASGNDNYGDMSVNCPNATAYVGGVYFHECPRGYHCSSNYGDISVISHSARVGGVVSEAAETVVLVSDRFSSLASFGNIYVNSADVRVGGIIPFVSNNAYANFVSSNCYSLAQIKVDGGSPYVGSFAGRIFGRASYYTYINNFYSSSEYPFAYEVGVGNNDVSFSNCFNVGGGIIGSVSGGNNFITNNVASIPYDAFYRNPSVSENYLYHYAFTNGGRDTNSFYDLILPINKLLFPTITEGIKQKHNWTKINGYKRYIKTIQQ